MGAVPQPVCTGQQPLINYRPHHPLRVGLSPSGFAPKPRQGVLNPPPRGQTSASACPATGTLKMGQWRGGKGRAAGFPAGRRIWERSCFSFFPDGASASGRPLALPPPAPKAERLCPAPDPARSAAKGRHPRPAPRLTARPIQLEDVAQVLGRVLDVDASGGHRAPPRPKPPLTPARTPAGPPPRQAEPDSPAPTSASGPHGFLLPSETASRRAGSSQRRRRRRGRSREWENTRRGVV